MLLLYYTCVQVLIRNSTPNWIRCWITEILNDTTDFFKTKVNRKFIIASFNLRSNRSPSTQLRLCSAQQVRRSEKMNWKFIIASSYFNRSDSVSETMRCVMPSLPFRSDEVNRARMQFERPRDARRPIVSVSRFVRCRVLIYAPIRSPRRRNASLVKPRVTDARKVAEVGEKRYSEQQSSSSFDMDWDR